MTAENSPVPLSQNALVNPEKELGPGGLIRQARERARMTVDELAAVSKLGRNQIDALERDDFSALLEPVYVRGYYRKCAKILGLQEADLIKAYDARVAPKPVEAPAKLRLASGTDLGSGARLPAPMAIAAAALAVVFCVFLWNIFKAPEAPATLTVNPVEPGVQAVTPAPAPVVAPAAVSVDPALVTTPDPLVTPVTPAAEAPAPQLAPAPVSVVPAPAPVAATVAPKTTTQPAAPAVTAAPAAPASTAARPAPAVAPIAKPAPAAAAPVASKPVVSTAPVTPPVAAAPSPAATAPKPAASKPVVEPAKPTTKPVESSKPAEPAADAALTLSASITSWVRVEDSQGKTLINSLVRAGEKKTLSGVAPYKVFLGNAPGVRLEYKGKVQDISAAIADNLTARVVVPVAGQ